MSATDPRALGIDVSKYQPTTPSLDGLSFLIARASIGTTVDPLYRTHIANARKAGLVVGAYHFGYNTIPIADQVRTFLAAAGDVDFYFLDVEGKYAPSRVQSSDFFTRMRAAGKKCGLYHSDSGYFYAGQDYDWVARWTPEPPTRKWDFWQYRGSPLDLDKYVGSRDELYALAGLQPPATEESPMTFVVYNTEVESRRKGKFLKGTEFYADYTMGTRLGSLSADATVEVFGARGSAYAVQVGTGAPYADGLVRPTSVFVAKADLVGDMVIEPVPADTTPFSQADVDAARAEGEASSAAALAACQADLAASRASLDATLADLEESENSLAVAEAELADWAAYKAAHIKALG